MKRGGSKMGYAEQFNLLSPCYKEGEQRASDFRIGGAKAKPAKKGKSSTKKAKTVKKSSSTTKKTKSKQKGGSSCGASPSVADMGVVATPASLELTASERAWDNRMKGGNPNGTINTKTQTNQLNNVSTYLNKLKDVVFDKGMTGFAIVVERTDEHASNSKQDKYKIKVIKIKNNNPTMNVLADKSFSDVLQTVRETSSDIFPLKKTNNKPQVSMNVSTTNVPQSVNYSIKNGNNTKANAAAATAAAANAAISANAATSANAAAATAASANAAAATAASANAAANGLFN